MLAQKSHLSSETHFLALISMQEAYATLFSLLPSTGSRREFSIRFSSKSPTSFQSRYRP